MEKSREAFRTISEVADLLDTPAHVLRFWESRFPQIRPVKRAGGRRYYRPTDVALLSGIKQLLHRDGLTIRGVQKILREHGIRHVMGLAEGGFAADAMAAATAPEPEAEAPPAPVAEVLPFPDLAAAAAAVPPRAAEELPLWATASPADAAESATAEEPVEPAPAEAPPEPVVETVAAAPVIAAATPAPGPSEDASEDDVLPDWLPSRLRALQPRALQHRRAELSAVAARLQDLRARLAAAAGAGGR